MKIVITLFASLMLLTITHAQNNDVDKLPGVWQVTSVKFKNPVDLNKDGVKSADAFAEYDACQKDQQLEIAADKTAKAYYGTNVKDCKSNTMTYTWKTREQKIRDVKYDNGKRIVTESNALILRLVDPEGFDSQNLIIVSITKKELTVRAEIRDGSDSTSEAVIVYKRKKK